NNTFANNSISNTINTAIYGIYIFSGSNNILSGNTVYGFNLPYFVYFSNYTSLLNNIEAPTSSTSSGFLMISSSNSFLLNNSASSGGSTIFDGFLIFVGSYDKLINNTVLGFFSRYSIYGSIHT